MNNLSYLGIKNPSQIYWNLTPSELVEKTISGKMGTLTNTGALAIDTGSFTGRSPKDKFIVEDATTKDVIWWGDVNFRLSESNFEVLLADMLAYTDAKELYARDAYACADVNYQINIRVVTEYPWSNLFANNLFIRPSPEQLTSFAPDWHIVCIPSFESNPAVHGTRQGNFTVVNITKKMILIGGSAYTGEIKKSIFTILNYILPHEKNVLSMHCSANVGAKQDTAIFFGLSGTGKTTLSADPQRALIGDDEHGWSDTTVFNFEGGCYAKCVDLTQEKEPQIFNAIRFGALVENTNYVENTRDVDYANIAKTENTRVAYPIEYIDNALLPSVAGIPENIFFLTCDAFGVLPPISLLTPAQAMYHFISGYTAKVAGTEMGITEPTLTFSACFGKAFLPLHPTKYATLLGEKLKKHEVKVWLINTGWSGGSYGVGSRMKLSYTRAMITAALNGDLNTVTYDTLPVFNLQIPTTCPNVPTDLLNPRITWQDKSAYDKKSNELAASFVKNFAQYSDFANEELLSANPQLVNVN